MTGMASNHGVRGLCLISLPAMRSLDVWNGDNAKILFQLAKLGAYAKVLLGFLHDCTCANSKIPLNKTEPLYIIELGAGSGKFSFFILQVSIHSDHSSLCGHE